MGMVLEAVGQCADGKGAGSDAAVSEMWAAFPVEAKLLVAVYMRAFPIGRGRDGGSSAEDGGLRPMPARQLEGRY